MAVVGHVKGWNEEDLDTNDAAPDIDNIGGQLAAPVHLHPKPQKKNGQKNMDEFRDKKRNSVIEVVNMACSRVLRDHGWVSEFSLLMHEHDILQKLNFDVKDESWESTAGLPNVALESAFKIPL